MKNNNAPILEARHLVKRFGEDSGFLQRTPIVHAVNDVSLSIQQGETFAIVGESGCGKSTLGRMLLRLIEPTEGEIFFEGNNITHLGPKDMRALRRDMQIIFQDPFASLNPNMTVQEIISEPIKLHKIVPKHLVKQRVEDLLQMVGLRPDFADRYPHEFSGGQRQRIGIARAIAANPKLIIGDEPVSALDVSIQAQVINLLEELKDQLGLTLVIVAHDLAVIRHMSDRVAVMYLGEFVEISSVNELYDQPLHPYTQALLKAIPIPTPSDHSPKQLLQGDVPNPTAPPSGCKFHTRCPHRQQKCIDQSPELVAINPLRSVACHFWEEIQSTQMPSQLTDVGSQKLNERLALYRQYQANQTHE